MLFELFGKIRRFSAYALVLGIIGFGTSALLATPVSAATGINQQLNFQGRLLNSQGAIVADGYYNVEFKIYQDGPGTTAGNPGGTLKWTEDWLNNNSNAVRVVNGYISVQLGSITPFGSSVDWNQDTLWLSVNIGNTNATCTPFTSCAGDGEMTPMKRLSAVPYALNTGSLNGLTSGQFVQLSQGVQNDASTNSSIFINKTTASGNLVQLQQSGANVFTVANAGAVTLQNTADSTSALSVKNLAGTSLFSVDTANGQTVLQGVQDTAPLSSELHSPVDLTNAANWTSTGWTTTATSATHTTGNTSTLQNMNIAITAGNYYQVSFDLSGSCGVTGDGIQAVLGGAANPTYGGGIYINWTMCPGTYTYGFKAVDTTKLRIIPTSGWGGTISNISVKQITSSFTPTLAIKNASGTTSLEIRTSNIASNQFIGLNSGKYNTTGGGNTANGSGSLALNTSGSSNSAFGSSALAKNTTGYGNTGIGSSSLSNNTSGVDNTAVGASSLVNNTSGTSNTAVGSGSLVANTSGSNNTANGRASLMANTSGSNNTAFGQSAAIANTTGSNNTAVGFSSLNKNTSGSSNVALGLYGLYNNTTGASNTAIGSNAGYLSGQFQTLNNLQGATMLGSASQAYANNVLALGGQGTNSTNIGIGTGLPTNRISAESYRYGTGTVTTDGTANIVGTGATFTSDMVGNVIYIATNSNSTAPYRRTITAFTDATHLTVSATVPALTNAEYYINYVGLQMTATGKLGVNTLNPQYDIDVAGTINASVSLLAPSIDTAAAGTLSIGTTNATSITLAKNVTVSSGMSLTLVGGATGTRPASPTEGMLYYDTTTKQLLTYANGKWQADSKTATVVVAASNSPQGVKDGAQYVATGTNDQTTINSALAALPASGGTVYLAGGTYNLGGTVTLGTANTKLYGEGDSTILKRMWDETVINNSGVLTFMASNLTIAQLKIDGNKAAYTNSNNHGIISSSIRDKMILQNLTVSNNAGSGIYVEWNILGGAGNGYWNINNNIVQNNSSYGLKISRTSSLVANNYVSGNGNNGIDVSSCDVASSITKITGNTSSSNTGYGYITSFCSYSVIANNTAQSNSSDGFNFNQTANGPTYLTISNNTSKSNTGNGFRVNTQYNTMSGNIAAENGAAGLFLQTNYTVADANQIYHNAGEGIDSNNMSYSTISNNNIYDNGGSGSSSGIGTSVADIGVKIIGNTITDTAGTGYAINIASGAQSTYLSNNSFSGTGAGSIADAGTGTVYSNQARGANGAKLTSRTADDTEAYAVQNASGANIFAVDTTNSQVVLGNSTTAGKLSLSDGSSNTGTIVMGALSGNYTFTIPTTTANDTFCLQTLANCGSSLSVGALDGGTANATGATISGSNFYLQSATVNYPGLVNTTTQTFAGTKTFNDGAAIAAGKTLTIAGGDTTSRLALTGTEGMMYYDTTTKQLLTYANGKWQADRSTATKIVAASNSSQTAKDSADYVATGTGDQGVINTALTAAAGGKVYLSEGTYTINASISVPNNTTLAGAGAGTIITIPNAFNANLSAIINTDQTTGTGITVQDVHLEGNKANQSGSGFGMSGIGLNNMGGGSGASARQGANIQHIISNNWYSNSGNNCYNGDGICLYSSSNNTVVGNTTQNNGIYGIYLGASSSNNTITSNTTTGNGGGILLSGSANNTITSNSVQGNNLYGIYLGGSSNNTLTGSVISGSGGNTTNNAIYINASNSNTITGNNITDTSATTNNYAINIFNNTSNKNYLADNTFSSTPGTSTINDAGTGTVYANQSRTENGGQLTNRTANDTRAFAVQTTAGTDVFAVDTTNSKVLVAGTLDTTTATTLNIGNASATSIVVGNSSGTAGISLSSSSITLGSVSAATVIQAATQSAANTAGNALTLAGSTGQGSGNGGVVTIQGGNGGASGLYGGSLTLSGGTGTTANGTVILATSTFQTATTDSGCFPGGAESTTTTNCTISQNSINNNASVIVGFTNDAQTAFMPDPSILTAGRVVYVTASNGTKDFTLSVNGGGQGNQISMRRNTTATMIWNGADWTAAGASSSTTMQAAYDNTLQSAGGAELIVSKTSTTNGLTIRDSSTNPVNGTLLSVQTQSAAGLLSVNSNVTEYTSNSGAETAGASATTFPAATWSAVGATTISRYNTAGNYIATGQGSVSVITPATANTGVKNQLTGALTANTTYNVSFTSRLTSGTFTDMNVYYSIDGSAASIACTTGASVVTSVWQKINCTFTTPTSGITTSNAILIRQTGATARTFYVDNASVTIAADYNFATDGSVNDSTNFATNWSTAGLGTVSVARNTSDGYDASDSATATISSGAANSGIRNKLSSNPLSNTLYRVTTYAKLSSGSFTDFKVRYSPDGGTSYSDCVDYNTQTISTTSWTKVTCYVTTAATAATNPYVYFVETASATRTFHVDNFSMTLSAASTPNIQVGGGINGGPTTLFTLDKGASAPIASDNDALLGSMYYDTTLGKLQCYEADGWGACGSSPDNIVTISPEYTNAVLHGTGIGTMTSDICSDTLNINDGSSGQSTICGTNETYNFYKWTSPQASAQTYGIYVTYQLPSTFKSFASGQTSLMGRTDSANATVNYQVYRNDPTSGLTACGSSVSVSTGSQSSWQVGYASGAADPSTCGFAPGDSIVFKISVTASQNANTYVGNLNFTFSNR